MYFGPDIRRSHALRCFLEQSSGKTLGNACGTDGASQRRYRNSLITAGFEVRDASIGYSLFLAFPASQLPPPDERPAFAEQVRRALQPHAPHTEHVHITMLLGQNR